MLKATDTPSCGYLLLCEFHACTADSTSAEPLGSDMEWADFKCFDHAMFAFCTDSPDWICGHDEIRGRNTMRQCMIGFDLDGTGEKY
jgi:hypothetical protein